MCHVSCVMCCMSCVTCQLSPTPTATATDPPPSNSPTMHSRLVCKDPNFSDTIFDQKSTVHQEAVFPGGDTHTNGHRNL